MTRFSIVGAGWRSEFFLRIARELPDLFEVGSVLARRPERAEELRKAFSVRTSDSLDQVVADKPDFVITSVSWDSNPVVIRELAERKISVLSETPPARSVERTVQAFGGQHYRPWGLLNRWRTERVEQLVLLAGREARPQGEPATPRSSQMGPQMPG